MQGSALLCLLLSLITSVYGLLQPPIRGHVSLRSVHRCCGLFLRPPSRPEELDDDFAEMEWNDGDDLPSRSKAKPKRPVVFSAQGKWKTLNRAVLAGIFVAGIGLGVTIDSAINTNPRDLASRDAIDRNAPNPKICATYGSSAMVLDQRVFITFNPFNIFVTQADTKPGCVLRASNVVPLLKQERKLITDDEINACKNSFNTWAYVGDINNKPQLNCVFQSDDAQNEFLSNPKVGLGEDIYDRPQGAPGKLPGPISGAASSNAPNSPTK